jgi:hypothetical protein
LPLSAAAEVSILLIDLLQMRMRTYAEADVIADANAMAIESHAVSRVRAASSELGTARGYEYEIILGDCNAFHVS